MQQPSVSIDHHTARFDWRSRFRAAGIHLALSALVAVVAGLLVFGIWYPFPYSEISGGRDLFQLVISVDVVLGPLLTFAVYSLAKPRKVMRRDLLVIVLLQLAGLAYGLWTVHLARPVHMVFEVERFRVVHQVEIPPDLVDKAPPGIDIAPLGGPTLLTLRPFRDSEESMKLTMAALEGASLSARPDLWQTYEAGRADVVKAAKPVAQLKSRFPQRSAEIDAAVRAGGGEPDRASYLPLVARKADVWTVLLDAGTARVLGYIPLDSF